MTTYFKLKSKVRMTSNGIVVQHDEKTVNLDPKRGMENGISFVSHAHLDHLHNQRGNGILIASKQTTEIASLGDIPLKTMLKSMRIFQ